MGDHRSPVSFFYLSESNLKFRLLYLDIPFRFTGLQSLKIKETDRITALRTELRKLGYDIKEQDDRIRIISARRADKEEKDVYNEQFLG